MPYATFGVDDAGVMIPDSGDAGLQVRYSLPEDLVGGKQGLRVLLVSKLPKSLALEGRSFSFNGVVIPGPCAWPDEQNSQVPACPMTMDPNSPAIATLAKGRCYWEGAAIGEKPLRCEITYGWIEDVIDIKARSEFLAAKYAYDKPKLAGVAAVSALFGHDSVGFLTINP